jgi:hypothetical protein
MLEHWPLLVSWLPVPKVEQAAVQWKARLPRWMALHALLSKDALID